MLREKADVVACFKDIYIYNKHSTPTRAPEGTSCFACCQRSFDVDVNITANLRSVVGHSLRGYSAPRRANLCRFCLPCHTGACDWAMKNDGKSLRAEMKMHQDMFAGMWGVPSLYDHINVDNNFGC